MAAAGAADELEALAGLGLGVEVCVCAGVEGLEVGGEEDVEEGFAVWATWVGGGDVGLSGCRE